MLIQGDQDEIVHYNGKAGAYSSAINTYEYWKKHNNVTSTGDTKKTLNRIKKDSTSVEILEAKGTNVTISLVSIYGGGHTWPGSDPFNIGFPLGRTSTEINANEIIWKFLSRHSRKTL